MHLLRLEQLKIIFKFKFRAGFLKFYKKKKIGKKLLNVSTIANYNIQSEIQ